MFDFTGKVVVITGGAQGIGACLCEQFAQAGAHVCTIDCAENPFFVGNLADQVTLEAFAQKIIDTYGRVDVLIHNAPPASRGIADCTYAQFMQAMAVGVGAPFYLTQLLMPYFAVGASVLNISSSRDRMSQAQTESYTAAKGGIAALTHALAASLSGKVRVNSISPGWIDTAYTVYEGADATQHTAGRVGNPMDIAQMALFLSSDQAGFINGENICIDGGMTKTMIYHADCGWQYHPSETEG